MFFRNCFVLILSKLTWSLPSFHVPQKCFLISNVISVIPNTVLVKQENIASTLAGLCILWAQCLIVEVPSTLIPIVKIGYLGREKSLT